MPASFSDVRNLLTAALCDDLISKDENLLLYDLKRSKNLICLTTNMHLTRMRWRIMSVAPCVTELRVNKLAR